MKRKTEKQIQAEIKKLKAIQPKVRRYGMMGDNHEAIDAQLHVLEKNLSDDEIWNRYGVEGEISVVFDAAMDAYRWLRGEKVADHKSLAAAWKELM